MSYKEKGELSVFLLLLLCLFLFATVIVAFVVTSKIPFMSSYFPTVTPSVSPTLEITPTPEVIIQEEPTEATSSSTLTCGAEGDTLSLAEALVIAQKSDCVNEGSMNYTRCLLQ